MFQTTAVRALQENVGFQMLAKRTVKQRAEDKQTAKYQEMRKPVRTSAEAARQAYARCRKAQPDTPEVKEMLKVGHQVIRTRHIFQVVTPGIFSR